jgi:hypothetical protein
MRHRPIHGDAASFTALLPDRWRMSLNKMLKGSKMLKGRAGRGDCSPQAPTEPDLIANGDVRGSEGSGTAPCFDDEYRQPTPRVAEHERIATMKLRYWTGVVTSILLAIGFYNAFIHPHDLKVVNVKNIPREVTFVCAYTTDEKGHSSLMNFYVKEFYYDNIEPLDTFLGCVIDDGRGLLSLSVQWRTAARWGLLCQTRDRKWMIAPVGYNPSVWENTFAVRFEALKWSKELPPDLKKFIDDEIEKEKKWRRENLEEQVKPLPPSGT